MSLNKAESVLEWNKQLSDAINLIDWDYLKLSSRIMFRDKNTNSYTSDPIGLSLSQLRTFSYEFRRRIDKSLLLEILEILSKYERYIGKNMEDINPNVMLSYISQFTDIMIKIRDYLSNNN